MASFSIEELAAIAIIIDEEETRKKRSIWVHKAWTERDVEGEFTTLYKELVDDETKFHQYFRMSQRCFNILLNKIKNRICKQTTKLRKPFTGKERLAICLRYLATGDSYKTISFSYRVGVSTVYQIIIETCRAIISELINEFMPIPTKENWIAISNDFRDILNFPNCLGALDGKHIVIQAPPNSGSQFFNDKKTFSIVLMALVDANYKFIMVDVGSFGKNSDGGILEHSIIGKRLKDNTLNVPDDTFLPGTSKKAPYVVVGDEAFPLKTYLLRPYPGKQLDNEKIIFNYRLSRARRVVENAFGILSQKFRIYNKRIQAKPENVDLTVLATCVLHNFIKEIDGNNGHNMSITEFNETPRMLTNLHLQGGNSTMSAFAIRDLYKDYFNSTIGSVPWQNEKI
ncbi:uncharacterized protein [Prorops nasuta]|uniref:uncharacterized protein n=1 Tax=Prorops nasuta TaxID=863751 RepID=UPI0034CD7016